MTVFEGNFLLQGSKFIILFGLEKKCHWSRMVQKQGEWIKAWPFNIPECLKCSRCLIIKCFSEMRWTLVVADCMMSCFIILLFFRFLPPLIPRLMEPGISLSCSSTDLGLCTISWTFLLWSEGCSFPHRSVLHPVHTRGYVMVGFSHTLAFDLFFPTRSINAIFAVSFSMLKEVEVSCQQP